jgi:V/A-type H+-transporting ATPase subunit D
MAVLDVKPNRMELLKLRKRVTLAQKGHKLLRDKQEELMRKFMALIYECKKMRQEVEKELKEALEIYIAAASVISKKDLEASLSYPRQRLSIRSESVKILNVSIPKIKIEQKPDYNCYGLLNTTDSLDRSLKELSEALEKMIRLSELESAIAIFSEEIKKTRRRVNALEYILIPNLTETIESINQKLTEIERSNLTRLMRVKELVESG